VLSVLAIGNNVHESNKDLCLAARAFGAMSVTIAGRRDNRLIRECKAIKSKWGGSFEVSFTDDWKAYLSKKKTYKTVYLTRYGIPLDRMIHSLTTYKNIMLIVTLSESAKDVYKLSDFNVSITSQPHSSAAAVAVFLHHFYEGRELAMHFENARYKVVPSEREIHVERIR